MAWAFRGCLAVVLLVTLVAFSVLGQSRNDAGPATRGDDGKSAGAGGAAGGNDQVPLRKIRLGMIAKSESNDVYQAAKLGAIMAAVELGNRLNLDIQIDWQTPRDEDSAKQVDALRALISEKVDGIMIAGSDASALTPVINAAADANIPVVCFNSDAPKSKRIAFYGVDDEAMGRLIMQELAKAMSDTGTIAILAGNEKAPNLQARLKGLREELKRHPNIHEIRGDGAFYCVETPQDGVTAMNAATVANSGIDGWALLGGWPLFTDQAFAALPPTIKCISADAMPKQFQYVSGGQVQELIAQDCYGWGYNSTEILLDRILNGPQPVRTFAARLTIVSKDNLDDYGKLWERMVQPMNRDLPLPDNRVSPVKVDDDPMKSIRERLHLQDSQ